LAYNDLKTARLPGQEGKVQTAGRLSTRRSAFGWRERVHFFEKQSERILFLFVLPDFVSYPLSGNAAFVKLYKFK